MKAKRLRGISMAEVIIRKRHMIEKIFGILVVISAFCYVFVNVNYDITKYLPSYAPSKQGLDIMKDEFGYPGTARVMIGDISIYEAKAYRDKIENIPGVDMVLWADSKVDIYESNQFINYDDIEDYYKDNSSIMDVTFDEGDTSKITHKAIDEITTLLGDKGYLAGSAVQNKSLGETLSKEMAVAMGLAVIMILIILCLTSTSWFEPFMFLAIMGIAIVINMGSNIFLGNISFLTQSVAAILQLAVAMDYSIFLLHAFTKEKETEKNIEKALANAIKISAVPIISGGATAFIGFIVLALMKFSVGFDMGIVLGKSIIVSIITVMFLMPPFILRFTKLIEKTKHRSFMPSFRKTGEFVYKFRYIAIIVIILMAIPTYVGQGMNTFMYGNDSVGGGEGTKVYEDEQKMDQIFGRSNLILALVPNESMIKEKALSSEIENLEFTKSVTSLANTLPEGVPESILPQSLTSQLHTDKYARILISVRTAGESDLAFKASDIIKDLVKKYYPENSYVVGSTPSTQDIKDIITKDYHNVDRMSLLGVALVIMITFRSVLVPVALMVPIEAAIFFNMFMPYLVGSKLTFMGYIIVSCIQLGATVDYSILLTNNYFDLRTTKDKKESAISAVQHSALSILTSGSILTVVGYGLYCTSSVGAIADLGHLVGRGAFLSTLLVLILLPALLVAFDKTIVSQRARVERLDRIQKNYLRRLYIKRKFLKRGSDSIINIKDTQIEEPNNAVNSENTNGTEKLLK